MRRLAVLGAALLALAVVYLIGARTQGQAQRAAQPAAQSVAVASISRSCPPAPGGTGAARIAMIALPAAKAGTAAVPGGSATFSAVPAVAAAAKPAGTAKATGTPSPTGTVSPTGTASHGATSSAKPGKSTTTTQSLPVTVTAPGTATLVTAPGTGTADGTSVSVTGQLAEGFEAEQVDASGTGLVSCSHPASDMWFVGTGASAGAPDIRLYLMNTGSITATVDVTLLTDTGQQNGMNNAITVQPHQVVTEHVAQYVRGSLALAMHVQTSSGQVAASVWEGDGHGSGAWLPQAGAPATTLVLPGLTVGSSAPRLFVAVPGAADSRLTVTAYTAAGVVKLFGNSPQDASADATAPYPLNSIGGSAAGLKLTSNVPIVAGVLVPGQGMGAFTTAVAPVTGQGVVAGNPAVRGITVGLLLTAPAGAVHATITVVGANGVVTPVAGPQQVSVTGGRTLAVAVPRPTGTRQPFSIVITTQPGSGPLYAARVVTSGTGGLAAPVASLLPVLNAPTSMTLPPVQNSYTAVIP